MKFNHFSMKKELPGQHCHFCDQYAHWGYTTKMNGKNVTFPLCDKHSNRVMKRNPDIYQFRLNPMLSFQDHSLENKEFEKELTTQIKHRRKQRGGK